MFYKMITNKRNEWYNSSACTVKEIINYIIKSGQMRDAQIDAIKTYLFLKVDCDNKPLWELFANGTFNTIDIDTVELSKTTREVLSKNLSALALYEYTTLKNDKNEQISTKLEEKIKFEPNSIDYKKVFFDIFNKVTYTDYLFSLPMGAGKTYLMATFIYLDLYFALNEPNNKAFAHNFFIFAPSGLKSSVVPSLKTIQKFNPAWILPEPTASNIKKLIKFEVLDQSKTANKSNKTKNPNVQKINIHQPLNELIGLVAVTNAEKVILDRVKIENGQLNLFEQSEDEKNKVANELRNLVGKLPNLSIYIDEVHHAVDDDIKLRGVVSKWAKNKTINSVIGFSGTPYLDNFESVEITESLSLKSIDISNVVYYYPLISGIDNFLKRPTVKISNNNDSISIVENGVRDFFDKYLNKSYADGTTAKLGIYCGKIETLEETIYPSVAKIVSKYGLNPNDVILKYHKGNAKYKTPAESQAEFETLDKAISKIRIVLLVQIGKEGWDCRSLTGIILSQKGNCPTNMVLQTSCRCLRQVDKGSFETALIWLNEFNAEKLNNQLLQQQHISIKELENAQNIVYSEIKRYNRIDKLKLPPVDFYQLKVQYNTITLNEKMNTQEDLEKAVSEQTKYNIIIKTQDFELEVKDYVSEQEKGNVTASYNRWLYEITKESFGFITAAMLNEQAEILKAVFDKATYIIDGKYYFSSLINQVAVKENIRKAYYEKRIFETIEEIIPESAKLLKVENFRSTVSTTTPNKYYPAQNTVEKINYADNGKLKLDKKTKQMIVLAEETGHQDIANRLREENIANPDWYKTYHYVPYKTDSGFEQTFLQEILKIQEFKKNEIEVYYNGDRALTEFKIKCFKGSKGKWKYLGIYTPDFLLIKRKGNKIYKAIIVETKGQAYAADKDFIAKKDFMQTEFIKQNNDKFGYKRFDYLYLEDSDSEAIRIIKTAERIKEFFEEEN